MSPSATALDELLPDAAVGVTASPVMWETPARPEEERLLGTSGTRRAREFRAGRHCARLALDQLGFPTAAVLRRPGGDPNWPPGVVGSITHCSDFAAAVVAKRQDIVRLGIDAEPHLGLEASVIPLVCTAAEQSWCREQDDQVYWETVVFSAKEAVYKALYPLDGRFLDFDDLEIELCPAAGRFAALPTSPRARAAELLQGRFRLHADLVHTVAWLSATEGCPGPSTREGES